MKYVSLSIISLVAVLLLVISACANNTAAEPAPPLIHYGEDVCEFCGMIISDERYAAGYITQDGQEKIFDDMGGMFQYHLQNQDEVVAFFVHDYEDTAWIRAETAHYVMSKELPTPMLHGLVACDSPEKAQALAKEVSGSVFTFNEVLTYYQEKSSIAKDDGNHQHRQP
jgi:copper chaperone NosL